MGFIYFSIQVFWTYTYKFCRNKYYRLFTLLFVTGNWLLTYVYSLIGMLPCNILLFFFTLWLRTMLYLLVTFAPDLFSSINVLLYNVLYTKVNYFINLNRLDLSVFYPNSNGFPSTRSHIPHWRLPKSRRKSPLRL